MTLIREVRRRAAMPTPDRARGSRERQGIGPGRLASELGVSRATVWRWETGRTPMPTGDLGRRYAALLDQLDALPAVTE